MGAGRGGSGEGGANHLCFEFTSSTGYSSLPLINRDLGKITELDGASNSSYLMVPLLEENDTVHINCLELCLVYSKCLIRMYIHTQRFQGPLGKRRNLALGQGTLELGLSKRQDRQRSSYIY